MNAALVGYGRMGREIEKILAARGHSVLLRIDENNGAELNADNLRRLGIEVAIEFTTPESAYGNIRTCLEAGVAVVCGTTGWLKHYDAAVALCREKGGAFFYASNYSLGVNLFFRLNEMLARMMDGFPQYDVSMEEVHHIHKKDAPSGTAITLAEGVVRNVARKSGWTMDAPEEEDIFIAVGRSGEVLGTHIVEWESEADSIVITHEAKNRKGLALGAVAAAEYLCGKRGVYSMADLLDKQLNDGRDGAKE